MMDHNGTPFTLQLFVTGNCNLRCVYCYEGTKKKEAVMDIETAKSAVSSIVPGLSNQNVIIDIIGGEPLLAFDFMKELTGFVEEMEPVWKKDCTVFASTNGTLLNDEKKEWLFRHRDKIVLGLSLDGTREAHNINRSGSYDALEPHFSFFRETWPAQPVKMTINSSTIDMVYDGILNIYRHGFKCSANVVFEDMWGQNTQEKERKLKTFASELEKLVDFFAKRPELEAPSLILNLPIQNLVSSPDKDWKWCGAGKSMKCVYVDGTVFDCHRFADIYGRKQEKNAGDVYEIKESNANCDKCGFFMACPTCDAYNFETNGSPFNKTTYHCELVKLQILATAKLRMMRLYYDLLKLYHIEGGIEKLVDIKANIDSIIYISENSASLLTFTTGRLRSTIPRF